MQRTVLALVAILTATSCTSAVSNSGLPGASPSLVARTSLIIHSAKLIVYVAGVKHPQTSNMTCELKRDGNFATGCPIHITVAHPTTIHSAQAELYVGTDGTGCLAAQSGTHRNIILQAGQKYEIKQFLWRGC